MVSLARAAFDEYSIPGVPSDRYRSCQLPLIHRLRSFQASSLTISRSDGTASRPGWVYGRCSKRCLGVSSQLRTPIVIQADRPGGDVQDSDARPIRRRRGQEAWEGGWGCLAELRSAGWDHARILGELLLELASLLTNVGNIRS